MVQLNLLSGPQAGARWVARRLPICLGRSSAAQIQLDASGVWDEHARLDFTPQEDFRLRALGDGFLAVNGALVCDCLLYTSDAADDLLCLDLGCPRILKKKNSISYFLLTSLDT